MGLGGPASLAGLAPSRASPALGRAGASFRAAGRGRGRLLCDAGPWRRSVGPGPRRTYRQLLAEGTPPKVASTVRRRTRSLNPNVTPPRSTTGGSGGRAAGEAMPFPPRQRSLVGLWAGAQVGRLDPSGAVMRKLVVLANAWWTGPPLVARTVRARRRGSVAGSVPFAGACGRVHNPRQRAPWSAVDRLWQLRLTRRPPWPRAAAPPAAGGSRKSTVGLLPISAGFAADWGVTCRGLAVGSPVLPAMPVLEPVYDRRTGSGRRAVAPVTRRSGKTRREPARGALLGHSRPTATPPLPACKWCAPIQLALDTWILTRTRRSLGVRWSGSCRPSDRIG